MQVRKIGVWVIFCVRAAQQIINGHFVKLRQLNKGRKDELMNKKTHLEENGKRPM